MVGMLDLKEWVVLGYEWYEDFIGYYMEVFFFGVWSL